MSDFPNVHDLLIIGTVLVGGIFNWARMEAGVRGIKDALGEHKADDSRNFSQLADDVRGVHSRIDALRDHR